MSSASSFASQRQHSHTDHAETETDSEWDRYTQDSEDEDDSLRSNVRSLLIWNDFCYGRWVTDHRDTRAGVTVWCKCTGHVAPATEDTKSCVRGSVGLDLPLLGL